jgi:hypothetical protein
VLTDALKLTADGRGLTEVCGGARIAAFAASMTFAEHGITRVDAGLRGIVGACASICILKRATAESRKVIVA